MPNQESLFSTIFQEAGIGMLLMDQSGRVLKSNRVLQEWLGYSADELQTMTFDQFTFPDDIPDDHDLFEALAQGKQSRYQVEKRYVRKDGDVVWGRVTVSLIHPSEGEPVLVLRIAEDIDQRKQIEQTMRTSASRSQAIFERAGIGIMVIDIEGRLLESNPTLQAMLGFTADELRQFTFDDITHPDDVTNDRALFEELVDNRREHYQIEKRLWCKDDSLIWVKTTVSLVPDENSRPQFAVRMAEDITARKQAEEALRKAHRAYRTLSLANQILVRATSEIQLLQDVCKVIVENRGYVLAWVGFAVQDESQSVYPAACAGYEAGYLAGAAITWTNTERGRGPTGTAIRTGQTCVAQHILTDPFFEPWRAEALRRGYASSIALPLLAGNRAFGALNIYAAEPDAFMPDEVALLEELASDLAFGIMTIRTRELHQQTERDLEVSEIRYRQIVKTAPDAIISADSAGNIVGWNQAAETIFGYSAEEVIGETLGMIMPERFRQTHQAGMQRYLSSREPSIIGKTVEFVGLRRDSHEFPLELSLTHWETGEESFFTAIIRDITKRKRAEERLRESEENFRLLFESNPHPMWVYDLETLEFLEVNDSAVADYGYSRDEFLSMRLSDIRPPEDTARLLEDIRRERPALQHSGEWRHKLKNGQIIDVEITSHTLEFAGRKAVLVVAQNITERKQAEMAEHEQRVLAEALRDTAAALISAVDFDAVMNTILENVARVVPHDAANIMLLQGDTAQVVAWRGYQHQSPGEAFLHEHRFSLEKPHLRKMFETGLPVLIADTTLFPGWETRPETAWIRSHTATPIRSRDTVIGFLNVDSDTPGFFTEDHAQHLQAFADQASVAIEHAQLYEAIRRHTAELEQRVVERTADLQKSEARYRAAIEDQTDLVDRYLPGGIMTFVNQAYCEYFQRKPEELLGTSFFAQMPDGERSRIEQHIASLNRENPVAAIEVREITSDGKSRWFHWIDSMLFDEQGNFVEYQAVGRDITERKQAEERLRLSDLILTNMGEGVYLVRTDGTIVYTNPRFEQLFGYEPGELVGRQVGIVNAPTDESPEETAKTIMQALKEYGNWHGDVQNIKKDGTVFWCSAHMTTFDHSEYGPVWIAIHEDITERRRAEEQLRRMLAHELELTDLKSRYVSMAAHDLRNPLAVIQSAVDIIRQYGDRLTDEQKQVKYVHIQTNIQVMIEMLNDILIIEQAESDKLRFDPAPLDVIAFCQNITAEAKQATGTTQLIEFSSQGACDTACLDAKLLRHTLGNLLSNALKYSPDEGTVSFTVDCEADQIIFRIQDQGIGIPLADQGRLFETFHRAANVGSTPGTGLGLAIVKQSVDLHGGTITVESEEGVGTAFTVTLPRISPQNASP